MSKKLSIIAFLLLCAICAHAETIVLRTGARVKGSIVFQNEEVVIVRDVEGARFQYPRAEVAEILATDPEEEKAEEIEEENTVTSKKVSILLELSGGAACIPNDETGGGFGVDLLVGSHRIGNRHLFIGGGLGYHGLFIGSEKYNFLPIQVALRMPFIEAKHAPLFGIALGYGVALSKEYKGGLYAGIDFGYRYQINDKTALTLSAFAQFQQAKLDIIETVDETDFIHTTYRYILTPGLKLSLYF